MLTRKRMATIALCLVAAALLAFVGGLFGKRTREIGREIEGSAELRCAYDGTAINPVYQVDAYLLDGSVMRFFSI